MSNTDRPQLTPLKLAQIIDVSTVQAFHRSQDVIELARTARKHQFAAAHALPNFVPLLVQELTGSQTLVGAPIGFPSGGSTTGTKIREAEELQKAGVQEADLMINLGRLLSGELSYVTDEIRAVVETITPLPVKVILEVHYLSNDQIKEACAACIEAGAAFVKTSTGWAGSGATLERIRLITEFVKGAIKVKASGGIRSFQTAQLMWEMGVERFGINLSAAIAILQESGRSAEPTHQ